MIMPKRKPPIPPPGTVLVAVDERWMGEWIAYGFIELSVYLEKHAAFDAYYQQREAA